MKDNQDLDPRFAQALYDPRFHHMSQKKKKVKIDERFEGILTNQKEFDYASNLYYQEKDKIKQLDNEGKGKIEENQIND